MSSSSRRASRGLAPSVALLVVFASAFAACAEDPLPPRSAASPAPGAEAGGADGGGLGGRPEGVVVLGEAGPHLLILDPTTLPVPQATEPRVGRGFSVNAGVHPRGKPTTWHVEYGPTPAYGATTDARALPGALSAHLRESWTDGSNGWAGGLLGTSVVHARDETASYLRYTDRQADEDDTNHVDGIGVIHLPLYGYVGNYPSDEDGFPSLYLGGGHADLRGARFSLLVRGVSWEPKQTTLVTWVQASMDTRGGNDVGMSNWANTGSQFGALLASGAWQRAAWTLRNRTTDWTYAGQNAVRNYYVYKELDRTLADVNVDLFPAQLVGVDMFDLPRGSIDFDELEITYRNHSVLASSNGGRLVPEDVDETAARLTDGWRHGQDHEWVSGALPMSPRRFRYRLDRPVSLRSVVVHNSSRFPSRDVRVRVSVDGESFVDLGTRTLPVPGVNGPNHLFVRYEALDENGAELYVHAEPVRFVEVTVLSGTNSTRWGLGEVEAFGDGAVETPDDVWDDVNRDVLVPPGTYHFRIVASNGDGVTVGPDQTVVVGGAPPSRVDAVDPRSGPRIGETEVYLYGESLADTQAVTVCGRPATLLGTARRAVLIQTPSGVGTCPIRVTTPSGSVDVPDAFAYE